MALATTLLLLAAATPTLQQDPVDDFCRRFGHQTAVIGDRLYIDGGLLNYNPVSQYPGNSTNTRLLYSDLGDVTDDHVPQLVANLTKESYVPDVSGGVLWADNVNEYFYQYGGEFARSPEDFTLWRYDVIHDSWNTTETDPTISRAAWGAGLSVSETGTGYWYGGWLSNNSSPGWEGPPQAQSELLIYSMDDNAWTNNSGPDLVGRAEGAMVFLPASDQGLLVYFGGVESTKGVTMGANMSNIHIYDLASSNWYTQTTTGEVPQNRKRFCAGASWPEDQSSYNIYLYGGADADDNGPGFDDVYILTLPSFTWIKYWPTEPGVGKPHNSLSCNVINGGQMLVIGGTFPLNDDQCDSPSVWGTHNLNLGMNGPNDAQWDGYFANITGYTVPKAIIDVVGGSSSGGATKTKPSTWANRDLPVYFSRQAKFEDRKPTRTIPKSATTPNSKTNGKAASNIGPIVGGTVGGVAALAMIIALWCCCVRRRRSRSKPAVPSVELPVPHVPPAELATQRWSAVEAPAGSKNPSVAMSQSPTLMSDHYSSLHSPFPAEMGVTTPAPQYYGLQDSPLSHPSQLGVLPEHAAQQYFRPPSQSPGHYPPPPTSSPGSVTTAPESPPQRHLSPPIYGPRPYYPHEHALNQQHFPRPLSPQSTTSTPAQFYTSQSGRSRFVEDDS